MLHFGIKKGVGFSGRPAKEKDIGGEQLNIEIISALGTMFWIEGFRRNFMPQVNCHVSCHSQRLTDKESKDESHPA